jgi:ubiquinone/menaquinone biosynthesis C-methylase UbiE
MRIYSKYVLPHLIDMACRGEKSKEQRDKVIPLASGRVLEIGIGAGNSLSLYDPVKVVHLTAIDPLEELWKKRRTGLSDLGFKVRYIRAEAEAIPSDDSEFDTVVVTFTLCSVDRIDDAMREIHRVLKPGGKLVFMEHGKAPEKSLEKWQNLFNPLWKRISGGCNLNRDLPDILVRNGFRTDKMHQGYFPGWKATSYHFWGTATPVTSGRTGRRI